MSRNVPGSLRDSGEQAQVELEAGHRGYLQRLLDRVARPIHSCLNYPLHRGWQFKLSGTLQFQPPRGPYYEVTLE